MKLKAIFPVLFFSVFSIYSASAQNVTLYHQFNGQYDFTFVGNTLNTTENSLNAICTITTASSATLNLNSGDVIKKAYLYWAGSGTGDLNVALNGQQISASRTFLTVQASSGLSYFGAFADVTSLVIATGNGTYNFSDLDLTAVIPTYCPIGGNFAGWAICVIYENPTAPFNQVNVYDGFQPMPTQIDITLNNLNVISTQDAKIAFLAWEGDVSNMTNETVRINGNIVGNPPLNPANNAFNGTNSYTGSSTLYNMDMDLYNFDNYIHVGDTSAQIQLTSGFDFVLINTIVTKMNSQLSDATIAITNVDKACDSRKVMLHYTVSNFNATADLPVGMPLAIYLNNQFFQPAQTQVIIPPNGSEIGSISILIPNGIPNPIEIKMVADDDGTGHGIVVEIDENNNSSIPENIYLLSSDQLPVLAPVISCNTGLTNGTFNFSAYENSVKNNLTDVVTFYASASDLMNNTNAISNLSDYSATSTPAVIFVKVDNGSCYNTTTFMLKTRNCPPTVYNYISANNDNTNDTFVIEGLRNVFMNFKLSVYNRWGKLVWTGDNNSADWDGFANKPVVIHSVVPTGTYYYTLELNDPDYPKPLTGFLYISH